MLTMSGPVTTVSILFSIFPARVLTSSSSRSLASWEQNRGDQTYNSQTTEVPTAGELGNRETALKFKCPWNTLKSDTRCQSLARKLNSVINERSVVWSREGRSRWDGSRPQLILVPPEDSIFQTIKAASKARHENVLRQSKMWRYFR